MKKFSPDCFAVAKVNNCHQGGENMIHGRNGIRYLIPVILFLCLSMIMTETVGNAAAQYDNYQILQRIKVPAGYENGVSAPNLAMLSPDGKKVIYIGRSEMMMLSEFRGNPVSKLSQFELEPPSKLLITGVNSVNQPVFSHDGKKIAYTVESSKTDNYKLMRNNDVIAGYPRIMNPVFSPDDQHLACVACTQKVSKDNKYYVILDGKEISPELEYVSLDSKKLIFSPDGSKLAYLMGEGFSSMTYMCKKYYIYANDQKFGPGIDTRANFFFAADNQLVYAAKTGNKYNVFKGGAKISSGFNDFYSTGLIFTDDPKLVGSPDGTKVAYKAKVDGKWWVMINDQKIAEFKWANKLVFSSDSSKVAYPASTTNGKWHIMLNDRQISSDYKVVGVPVFSPDGAKIAYWALDQDKFLIMINDQQISEVPVPEGMKSGEMRVNVLGFTPDGSKLLYKYTYVVNNPKFLVEDVYDPWYSCLVLQDKEITPHSGNFIVADYKFGADGIYFVGYYLDLRNKADIYRNKGELIHGFARY